MKQHDSEFRDYIGEHTDFVDNIIRIHESCVLEGEDDAFTKMQALGNAVDDWFNEAHDDFKEYRENQQHGICSNCNGSGEGIHDGTTCSVCNGKGEV